MNYYERHIGDYVSATAHLSLLEHGVYNRLLDVYYAREAPIPAAQAARLIGARTKEEREAVDAVLAEFFVREGEDWRHTRCDEVLAQYQQTVPAREARKEHQRERQNRARERRRQVFEQLRDAGVTAPFDTPMSQLVTLLSRVTDASSHAGITRDVTVKNNSVTASHLPSPISHLPEGERPVTPVTPPVTSRDRKSKRRQTTPLPEDFELTDSRRTYAEQHLPGVDAGALFATFCDMARAKAWEYADWNAHWQTLVRQWAPQSGHWSAGQYPKRAAAAVVHGSNVIPMSELVSRG